MIALQINSILQLLESLDAQVSSASSTSGAFVGLQAESHSEKLESIELKLIALTRKMQRWRNSTLMINQLPPEILAHVFDFSRNHDLPGAFKITEAPDLSLMAISSVCRYWRETASEFSRLWTNIDTAHAGNAVTYLRRSGVAPLRVSIRPPWEGEDGTRFPAVTDFCKALALHSARLHELHIQADPMDPRGFVSEVECFNHPAPKLRSLSVSVSWSSQGILPVIFGGQNPRLERLLLEGIRSWTGNTFRNLTHLVLSGQSLDNPLTYQLYEVLAASPDLSELCLCFRTIPSMRRPVLDFVSITPIILEHLRTLCIRAGYASQVVPLISRLVIPPGVKISVHDTSIRFDQQNEFQLLLANNLGGLLNFSKLGIQLYDLSCIELTGMSGPTTFSFRLQWGVSERLLVECIDYIFAKAGISRVRELRLKHFDFTTWSGVHWSSRFRRMASLEEIVVIGKEGVSDAIIAGLLPFKNSRGETEIPCPDLSVLQVMCPPTKGAAIPSLARAIKQRRANYCSIQLLRLSQAYLGISVNDIAQMRNDVKIEFISDSNYISEMEFPEVYGLNDMWPPNW